VIIQRCIGKGLLLSFLLVNGSPAFGGVEDESKSAEEEPKVEWYTVAGEKWVSRQGLFNLAMAMELPQLELDRFSAERIESGEKEREYEIAVTWTNTGKLPVALKQAQLVKIVQEDRVQLEFDKELLKKPDPVVTIVEPSTHDKTIRAGYAEPGQSRSVRMVVRVRGEEPVEGKAKVLSTRGGYIEVPFKLE
jgi:hypothetical protein